MAYEKTYARTIPFPRGESVDDDQLAWLVAESFYRKAESDGLTLVEFRDAGSVAPDDIPPAVDKQIGQPSTDFVWRKFTGVGRRAAGV